MKSAHKTNNSNDDYEIRIINTELKAMKINHYNNKQEENKLLKRLKQLEKRKSEIKNISDSEIKK